MRITPALVAACVVLGALPGCEELPLPQPVIARFTLHGRQRRTVPARSQAAPLDTTWTLEGEVTIVGTRGRRSAPDPRLGSLGGLARERLQRRLRVLR